VRHGKRLAGLGDNSDAMFCASKEVLVKVLREYAKFCCWFVLYKNNSDTSRDDIRVASARMVHGAVNKLIGETRPFPQHHMHPRGCLSGDLAGK
jgi:hypothetical protein